VTQSTEPVGDLEQTNSCGACPWGWERRWQRGLCRRCHLVAFSFGGRNCSAEYRSAHLCGSHQWHWQTTVL